MNEQRTILVWDAPTRLFHWLLAASFAGAMLSGEAEGWRQLHLLLGYTAAGLIAFRIFWGVAGTRYARFSSLSFDPRAAVRYLRSLFTSSPEHHAGHNPAASWAVAAILALVGATALSGWALTSEAGGESFEGLHGALAGAACAMVVLHVLAVFASSLLHRENLVRSMLTGRKRDRSGATPARGAAWPVAGLLAAAVVALWFTGVPAGLGGNGGIEGGASQQDEGDEAEEHGDAERGARAERAQPDIQDPMMKKLRFDPRRVSNPTASGPPNWM
jgi:cytochrome b